MQFGELPRLWRSNVFDFVSDFFIFLRYPNKNISYHYHLLILSPIQFVWLVSFSATAFLNITYGLALSLAFSLCMSGLRRLLSALSTYRSSHRRSRSSSTRSCPSSSPTLPRDSSTSPVITDDLLPSAEKIVVR